MRRALGRSIRGRLDRVDPWSRRAQVSALLRSGTRGKLAGATGASERLERAYALAHEPTPLHAPWPALTAYRLAHALLAQPTDQAPYPRIAALFEQATAFGHLGPWPHIFRLAALHRDGAAPSDQEASFQAAFAAYRSWMSRAQRSPDPDLSGLPTETARTDLFNLLDLAGCFIGADRSGLRGHGLRTDFEDSDGPFMVLVSATTGVAALARSLAEAEFEVLRQRSPEAIALALPLEGPPQWWVPGLGPSNSGDGEMRLLVSLLLRDTRSVEAQATRVTGRSDRSALATLRQLRRRLRERLIGGGLDLPPEDMTARDEDGRFYLASDEPIVAMVSERRYRSAP